MSNKNDCPNPPHPYSILPSVAGEYIRTLAFAPFFISGVLLGSMLLALRGGATEPAFLATAITIAVIFSFGMWVSTFVCMRSLIRIMISFSSIVVTNRRIYWQVGSKLVLRSAELSNIDSICVGNMDSPEHRRLIVQTKKPCRRIIIPTVDDMDAFLENVESVIDFKIERVCEDLPLWTRGQKVLMILLFAGLSVPLIVIVVAAA